MAVTRRIPRGDVDLDDEGRVVMLEGAAYVRQTLSCRFRFFLREWKLNLAEGIPYFQDIFVKNPNVDVIRGIFRKVIRSVAQVAAIQRLDPVYDPKKRKLSFRFTLTLVTGEALIVLPKDEDFILDLKEAA